jgi:hypothetical protein
VVVVEVVVPRFYFHLVSVDRQITDDQGKELNTLNDAYDHARKLIDKILCHLGSEDGKAWKVVALSEKYNVQIIVPFPASDLLSLHVEQSNSPDGSGATRRSLVTESKLLVDHLNALRHPTASASSDVQNHLLAPLSILSFA